jgi:GNAT superfamily N-acetyltransferase
MNVPPVTFELVRRLEEAIETFSVRRLATLAALPDNPTGLELERYGEVVAPACPARPDVDFLNRVGRLSPDNAGRVGELVARYRRLGIRAWFELAPHPEFERLAEALADAGAAQVGFYTALYGSAEPAGEEPADVRATRADPAAAEPAARLLLHAHGAPADALEAGAASIVGTGASLYVATVDGVRAGAAALSTTGGVGLLALAATLPEFRRRGAQTALIRARLEDAAASGCDVVATVAEFASPSQRNLERAGLRIAYTKAVWRLR